MADLRAANETACKGFTAFTSWLHLRNTSLPAFPFGLLYRTSENQIKVLHGIDAIRFDPDGDMLLTAMCGSKAPKIKQPGLQSITHSGKTSGVTLVTTVSPNHSSQDAAHGYIYTLCPKIPCPPTATPSKIPHQTKTYFHLVTKVPRHSL